jgi:hypothetical protein
LLEEVQAVERDLVDAAASAIILLLVAFFREKNDGNAKKPCWPNLVGNDPK